MSWQEDACDSGMTAVAVNSGAFRRGDLASMDIAQAEIEARRAAGRLHESHEEIERLQGAARRAMADHNARIAAVEELLGKVDAGLVDFSKVESEMRESLRNADELSELAGAQLRSATARTKAIESQDRHLAELVSELDSLE